MRLLTQMKDKEVCFWILNRQEAVTILVMECDGVWIKGIEHQSKQQRTIAIKHIVMFCLQTELNKNTEEENL